MDKRKALLIIIVVVVTVIAALAVFYFFFRNERVPTPPDSVFPVGPDLPLGGGTGTGTGGITDPETGLYENRPQTFEQKLRVISTLPVSGATLYDKNAETFIRYVERSKGNIFETVASKNEAPYRISNTTIPKIQEAYWVQNGSGVVLRYLKDDGVQTYYTAITPSATTSEQALADGTFLANNISEFTTSPARDRIFYITHTADEAMGIRANPNGTSRTQLFSSPAREWLVSWPRASTIALSTKPSANVPGLLFFLDTNSGALRKVVDGINGLTALPNTDASVVLISESATSRFTLKLLSLEENNLSEIGIDTLPEKCVWSAQEKEIVYCAVPDNVPVADYPDAWYQGRVSFTDNIWRIDTRTGNTRIVLSPQSVAKTTIDIINLSLSANEKYLLFMNKKDLSLWLLTLDSAPQE